MSTILLIIYILLFFLILKKWRFFRDSGISTNALWGIFSLKMIAGLLLTWVYTSYYPNRLEADIFKYFDDSEVMYNALFTEPVDFFKLLFNYGIDNDYFFNTYYLEMNNWDRFYDSNTYNDSHTIIRANALIRVFSMGNFHVHTLAFSMLSMIGLTALFKAFKEFFLNKKGALIIIIFLIPSVLFWSSGALKESILIFGLGILVYSLKEITTSNRKIKYFVLFVLSFLLLFYIKFYVLLALSPCILAYVINSKYKIKYPLVIYSLVTLICSILAFNANKIPPYFDFVETIVRKQKDFIGLVNYNDAGSRFELTELKPTLIGIVKVIPEAVTNCLIRPLPWKNNTSIYIPSILENISFLLMFILTLITALKKKITLSLESKNIFYFSLLFTLLLFTIIGLTTPVSGALVRYKVPVLPFLGIALLFFLDIDNITKKVPFLNFLK